jgi:hypothetical protein
MLLRLCRVGGITAYCIGLATPVYCASLTDLSPNQRQTATCMVAVVGKLPEVTEPNLTVSDGSERQIFITYKYHHKFKGVSPGISFNKINITDLVSHPHQSHNMILGGIAPIGSTDADLDDIDDGMLRITDLWQRQCGLNLIVMTD